MFINLNPGGAGKLAAEVVQGQSSFADIASRADLDPGLRQIGRILWGAAPLEWTSLPYLKNFRFSTIKIGECELTSDEFENIFLKYQLNEVADQLMFISVPVSQELNMNVVDFRSAVAKEIGFSVWSSKSGAAGLSVPTALSKFDRSVAGDDPAAFEDLRSGALTAAWETVSPAHRPAVAAIAASLCFHRIQKGTKFIEAFGHAPILDLAGWLAGLKIGNSPNTFGSARADAVFSRLQAFSNWTEKCLRRAAQVPEPGKSLRSLNGALPKPVDQFMQQGQIAATKSLVAGQPITGNAQSIQTLRPHAVSLIDRAAAYYRRFFRLQAIRDDCVADVAKEARISAPDPAKVSCFRSYSAGLTPRALMLACTIEALFVAKRIFPKPAKNIDAILSGLDRAGFCRGLPPGKGSLATWMKFVPYADPGIQSAAINLVQIQAAAISGNNPKIRNMMQGGMQEDIALAHRFLGFIYEYARWESEFDPEQNSTCYREYRWRELYSRFGLFGHMFC